MDRRGFLGSILALGAAPAIVRADSLMRIIPREAAVVGVEFFESDIIIASRVPFDQITAEALRIAHEKMCFIRTVNRQYVEAFAKQGDTIVIRRPLPYTVTP